MSDRLSIIGLAGTNGSGKDTVGHMLAEKHGYLFVSITDILRSELKRRGLNVTRENLRTLSAEWRRELGLGVLVDKAVADYEAAKHKYKGVVISSLRNPGEADRVHALGGTVLWVDADQRVRYERIKAAASIRGRQGEDAKTFEQFQKEEAIEMNKPAGADDTALDMTAVKAKSDAHVDNGSNDLAVFETEVLKALGL